MKTIHSGGFALTALLLAASCGCSSAQTITRGQNPISDSAVTPAGHGIHPAPHEAMVDHYRYTDVSRYEVNENGQIVSYDPHQQMHAAATTLAQNCPTCRPNPACPHCQGHPPHGQTCPMCQNSHASGHFSGTSNHISGTFDHNYPRHHFTYDYIRPKNLLYPPPQVPGGAVVYPYYTHKGPSDFFRAE